MREEKEKVGPCSYKVKDGYLIKGNTKLNCDKITYVDDARARSKETPGSKYKNNKIDFMRRCPKTKFYKENPMIENEFKK